MIYFIVFITLSALALPEIYKHPNLKHKYFLFVVYLGLVLVATLRYETGTDWEPYFQNFYFDDFEEAYDLGYRAIKATTQWIFHDYSIHLFFISIPLLVVFWFVIHSSNQPALVSLAFFSGSFVLFLGANRQQLAFCLSFLVLHFLLERRFWRFLFWLILSSFFHKSVLIILPFYWIAKRYWKAKYVLIISGLCFVIGVSGVFNSVLFWSLKLILNLVGLGGYSSYIGYGVYVQSGIGSLVKNALLSTEKIFLLSVFLFKRKDLSHQLKNFNGHFNLVFYSYNIFFLFVNSIRTIAGRGIIYFRISEYLLMALIPLIFQRRSNQLIAWSLLILYLFFRMIYVYFINPYYTPYKSVITYLIEEHL